MRVLSISVFCWLMVAVFTLCVGSAAQNITAEEVIQNCVDRYEEQMEDVQDMTVVTNRGVTYQKRATVKGETIYKTRSESEVEGGETITIYDGVYLWQQTPTGEVIKQKIEYNPFQIIGNLNAISEPQYEGVGEIDGHKTHILYIKDLTELASSFAK